MVVAGTAGAGGRDVDLDSAGRCSIVPRLRDPEIDGVERGRAEARKDLQQHRLLLRRPALIFVVTFEGGILASFTGGAGFSPQPARSAAASPTAIRAIIYLRRSRPTGLRSA
jgi:hypothetical protein